MKLALHKIIGAIRVEENVISGIGKLEKYALDATSSSTKLAIREVKKIENVMHINGKATHVVASQLAMGFTTALHDVYKLDSIPRSLELRAIEDVKLKSSFKVGEHIQFSEKKFTPELSAKVDNEAKKVLSSTDIGEKLTPEIVERNPALNNIFKNVKGKTVKAVGGVVVTIGLTTAAFCIAVNEHRIRLTGCMMSYYDENKIFRQCVIPTCTCRKIQCTKNCNYCDTDLMRKYLPQDMLINNCGDFKESAGCVNCPSENYQKKFNIDDDNTLQATNNQQEIFIRCQQPTFFDAFSDLFGGISESLLNIVKDSVGGVSWIIKNLPTIIIFTIGAIIIGVFISLILKFGGNGGNNKSTILLRDDSKQNLIT